MSTDMYLVPGREGAGWVKRAPSEKNEASLWLRFPLGDRPQEEANTWLWRPLDPPLNGDAATLALFSQQDWHQLSTADQTQAIVLWGQMAKVVQVNLPGQEFPSHYASAVDLAYCTAVPVALAFPLIEDLPEGTTVLPRSDLLPPPQWGQIGLIAEDGKWQRLEVSRIGAAAEGLFRQLSDLLRAAAQKYEDYKKDPDLWLSRWTELQAIAQRLAALYYQHHQSSLGLNQRMEEAREVPQIANIFRGDMLAEIPSPLAVPAILSAYSAAADEVGWHKTGDEPFPTFTYKKPAGTTVVQVRPPDLPAILTELTVESLWKQVREFSDLDGDVLLAMLAQAIASKTGDGQTWITADHILDYRQVQKKRIEEPNGRVRYSGHRKEDRAEVAACIERQSTTWISLDQEIRNKGGKKLKLRRESPLTTITQRIVQEELNADDVAEGGSLPIAWKYKPGDWLDPFLETPNRQTAWLLQQALKYDPYHEKWEKRLARYFMFHLRINAAQGDATITRHVGKLLDELSLLPDYRYPQKTRDRFERALHRLVADKQIDEWRYPADNPALPPKRWLQTWLDGWKITIAVAGQMKKYESISEHTLERRTQAALVPLPRGKKKIADPSR